MSKFNTDLLKLLVRMKFYHTKTLLLSITRFFSPTLHDNKNFGYNKVKKVKMCLEVSFTHNTV